MIELKEYLKFYDEERALDAILAYCSQDEVIDRVPKLLVNILENKINKNNKFINWTKAWLPIPSQYYDTFDYETAHKLDKLTRMMQTSNQFSAEDIKWMKNFVLPDKSKGIMFWSDLYEMIEFFKEN